MNKKLLLLPAFLLLTCAKLPVETELPRDDSFDQPAQSARPAAPSNLTAQALGSDRILLTWTDNASNEDGFYVEGGTFPGSRDSIRSIWQANLTSFIDTNLLPNTRYYYVVKCHIGDSVYSNFTGEISCSTFVLETPPLGMKLIPGGTFQMGQIGLAEPVHSVSLSSFCMDSTEVTQADYLGITSVNPAHFIGNLDCPVESLTWFDAVLYCNARSNHDGRDTCYTYSSRSGTLYSGCTDLGNITLDTSKHGYRLPTEAEWEYACRAGTTTNTYWGGASLDGYIWYDVNSANTSHPVGGKTPNTWGLYDMNGNAWEWCHDWNATYTNSSQTDPVGPVTGSGRVVRGGAWDCALRVSAYRSDAAPGTIRASSTGFRVVCRP